VLKVEHLTKVYEGGTLAVEDVSFEFADGEFLAVIGLSEFRPPPWTGPAPGSVKDSFRTMAE
jgi:hypothetical protein